MNGYAFQPYSARPSFFPVAPRVEIPRANQEGMTAETNIIDTRSINKAEYPKELKKSRDFPENAFFMSGVEL